MTSKAEKTVGIRMAGISFARKSFDFLAFSAA